MASYHYAAQTIDGHALTGNLTADTPDAARTLLESLHLRIMSLTADPTLSPPPNRAMTSTDFQAFNTQLAHLTAAGLPVERGLRLMAQDLRSGRLAKTTQAVADEMASGASLAEAFARHERQFPPLYSRLVHAGVQTNNLPGMLLNLGRHLELVTQLRAALWRALAYPLVLFVGLALVLTFLTTIILPKFSEIFNDFRITLPAITLWVMAVGPYVPWLALVAVLVAVGFPLLAEIFRMVGAKTSPADLLLPLPLIGPLLRRNLLARWCDALHLAVAAGLPLPDAIKLAGEAVGSKPLDRDSQSLANSIAAGQPVDSPRPLLLIPPTVLAAIALGSEQNNLPIVLENLSDMYQQQARQRVATLPAFLTALLMFLLAGSMFLVISAMFLPLVKLIQSVSGD